jgi:hypothetical protein
MNIYRSQKEEVWDDIKLYVTDLPHLQQPYETRLSTLRNCQREFPQHVRVADVTRCNGGEHFDEYVWNVNKNGGSGVIIRHPQSLVGSDSFLFRVSCKFVKLLIM